VVFHSLVLVLVGPFLLDLVLVRCVDTLPDLNDLFLLEGHSTSSITISYSIVFYSAPGSAEPSETKLSEARWR
jgi:hypothetical protein